MLPGDDISEEQLALELGTSRTPIREALLQLEKEHLVDIYPRKGTFVSQISLQDIYEIFQIRQIIECYAAKMVCKRISIEKLEQYREAFTHFDDDSDDYRDWMALDREFHTYIVENTQNKNLTQIFVNILDKHQRARYVLASRIPNRVKDSVNEHFKIIDALIEQDEQKIEEAVKLHINNSREGFLMLKGFFVN
jgi:DNA-binding GntR family transcriptional regulator